MSIAPELLKEGLAVWVQGGKDGLPGVVKSFEPGGPTWCYVTVEVYKDNPFAPGQQIKQTIRVNNRKITRREVMDQPPALPPRKRITSLTAAEQVHLRGWLQRYAALNCFPALEGLVNAGQQSWSWAMQRRDMDWCFDCIEAITAQMKG